MAHDNYDIKLIPNGLRKDDNFLPRNEIARLAVLRSREIVRKNNEYITKIKEDSNISDDSIEESKDAEFFSVEDSYAFDLYKIKSKTGLSEFIKGLFGV